MCLARSRPAALLKPWPVPNCICTVAASNWSPKRFSQRWKTLHAKMVISVAGMPITSVIQHGPVCSGCCTTRPVISIPSCATAKPSCLKSLRLPSIKAGSPRNESSKRSANMSAACAKCWISAMTRAIKLSLPVSRAWRISWAVFLASPVNIIGGVLIKPITATIQGFEIRPRGANG